MFERHADQAFGLRKMFAPPAVALLPFGCVQGDQADRESAIDLARALERAGRQPFLIDLLHGDAGASKGEPMPIPRIAAHEVLGQDFDGSDLVELAHSLRGRSRRGGARFDTLVLAGDPLRLADLTAGLSDRLLLFASADSPSLARVYAQIKAIGLAHGVARHAVVFRDARTHESALAAHRRLAATAARFLRARIEFGGAIASLQGDPRPWDRLAPALIAWSQPLVERAGVTSLN